MQLCVRSDPFAVTCVVSNKECGDERDCCCMACGISSAWHVCEFVCVCVCSQVHVCMQSASSYSSSDGHHKAASDHAELDQDLADIRNGTLHHAAAEKPCVADVVSTDQAAENSSSEENKMTYVFVCVCVCVCVCVNKYAY